MTYYNIRCDFRISCFHWLKLEAKDIGQEKSPLMNMNGKIGYLGRLGSRGWKQRGSFDSNISRSNRKKMDIGIQERHIGLSGFHTVKMTRKYLLLILLF